MNSPVAEILKQARISVIQNVTIPKRKNAKYIITVDKKNGKFIFSNKRKTN